jgi:hypothetical protein
MKRGPPMVRQSGSPDASISRAAGRPSSREGCSRRPRSPRWERRVEWRVRGAARIGTPEEGAVPPDDLRVVAAGLSGRAAVRGVVVIRRFRGPRLHHLGDAGPVPRRARRDVLSEVSAARVVLVHAVRCPLGCNCLHLGRPLRSGERGRRGGRRGAADLIVRLERHPRQVRGRIGGLGPPPPFGSKRSHPESVMHQDESGEGRERTGHRPRSLGRSALRAGHRGPAPVRRGERA